MTSFYPPIEWWHLPQRALDLSYREMARDGQAGNEGVALWLGHRDAGSATITHVLGLRGRGVIKRPDLLQIEPQVFNDAADLMVQLGVALIGQIHSHGPGYSTNFSPTDRECGIMVPDYLSLVAPDFALHPAPRVEDCGVHVFEPQTGYRRMSPEEIARRVEIGSGNDVSFLMLGEENGYG